MDMEGKTMADAELLGRTIKRLHRLGKYNIEDQLLSLALEIEGYRDEIIWLRRYIDEYKQKAPACHHVVVKRKKKTNPALLVMVPPLPVGYEPDNRRRKRRQP